MNGRQVNGLSKVSSLADIIFEFRTQAKLTQQELADEIGVARSTELRWEHGVAVPNLHNIRMLAKVLGIPQELLQPYLMKNRKKRPTGSLK